MLDTNHAPSPANQFFLGENNFVFLGFPAQNNFLFENLQGFGNLFIFAAETLLDGRILIGGTLTDGTSKSITPKTK